MMIKHLFQKFRANEFIVNAISILINGGIIYVISFLTSIIIARALGPNGQGQLSVAVTVCGIGMQLGNLGLHSADKYYVADNPTILPKVIGNTLFMLIAYSIISVITYSLFCIFPSISPLSGGLLVIAMMLVPIRIVETHLQSILISLNSVKLYNRTKLMQQVIYPVLVWGLFVTNVISPQLVFFSSYIAAVIPFVIAIRFCINNCKEKINVDLYLLKTMLPYGIKSYLSSLFAYLVFRSDILMVRHFLGEDSTGIYSVASSLADALLMITSSVSVILTPKLIAKPSDESRFKFADKTISILAIIMLCVTSTAAIVCGLAIDLVYGVEYRDAAMAFRLLMPGILFWGLTALLSSVFSALNKLEITILGPLLAVITNITLNYFLIPCMGINGAAIASSIAYFVYVLVLGTKYIILRNNVLNKNARRI